MTSNLAAEQFPNSHSFARVAILVSLLLPPGSVWAGQAGGPARPDDGLVTRALAAELKAAQDTAHPMQYRLRKSTPRLTSTKAIVETRDGAVARLVSIDDNPPSAEDRQKDEARLDGLLADPSRQQKRKQSEKDDMVRALKVLRALPKAFIYQDAGPVAGMTANIERYTFIPNPKFNTSDLELLVLTAMRGELWIDSAQERVLRLEGHLEQEVDFGWGILGRLNKGGWLLIEQANVGDDQWRIVRFKMVMSGRIFVKTRSFDTTEEETQFAPVPVGMTYQQAIQMLRSGEGSSGTRGK
jgi:hypothetical protein